MSKIFIFGIDGAFPEYIFGEWKKDLPSINKLMNEGSYAKLDSTIPCLSVTAWSSILTGKPPVDTGLFEYIQRKKGSYDDWNVVTSRNLKEKTIWQILSEHNKKSIICNILLTWPIKPFNGIMITGPLTPSTSNYIYPNELEDELKRELGEIPPVDVPNFRSLPKEEIAHALKKHTEKQIEIMHYLFDNKEWDMFFAMIPMSDRMNHAFWKYMDPQHRKYDPNSPLKNTLKEFYQFLDKKLGEFLSKLDKDTKVIVISDHGITRLHTRINLTDWLIKEGYMHLKEPAKPNTHFKFNMVDWGKTRAFAIGAYEGQIFLNLEGREPQGIVKLRDYETLLEEIVSKIRKIPGDDGKKLDTKFFKKKDFFEGKHFTEAPDVVIYFDNLEYGCNTTLIGNTGMWSPQTALGSDDAGHSQQGIFILSDKKRNSKNLGEISYLDVAPTILHHLDVQIPEDMKGNVIN